MNTEIISLANPKSLEAEAYRTLRTNLQFSSIDKPLQSIVVTSSQQGEGKSTTIANLAVSFAQNGKRVIIVDGDMRRPRVHKFFKVQNLKGVTDLLTQNVLLNAVIQVASDIHLLTCGITPPNPSELLNSNKFKELIQNLTEHYDIVLIDAPPVGVVADAAIISTLVDGVLFVVASGETETEHAKRAFKLLGNVNAHILGTVITKAPMDNNGYYGYQYYEYNTHETKKKKRR